MHGAPAAGMALSLRRVGEGTSARIVAEARTNADGRTDGPLLGGERIETGDYELVFDVEGYFRAKGAADAGRFLGAVTLTFRIDDAAGSYHVPLLVSPWSYSTYRGS
jgi:5-hydroxyisourate hydrolase